MNTIFYQRILTVLMLSCTSAAYSQLAGSSVQLWEKTNPTLRESTRCADENLLNFHCGIKDKLIKKYIRYSKNNSHTLSLVHTSKDDELIWGNDGTQASLSNTAYVKNKNAKKLGKRPSIFSYLGNADQQQKADSLRIRFEDQNLYEMIFFPKKLKPMDLNKIHSYLSVKYGISLEKGKYYGSDGKVVWDPEQHQEYRYRPTGLGRDDGNELYQKQSSNQSDLFLSIGINAIARTNFENPSIIDHHNFVMWSDDNKPMALKTDRNGKTLERNWEISFVGNTIPKTGYAVRILKETVNPGSAPLSYWMMLKKGTGEILKIPGVESGKYILFGQVDFLDAFDTGNTATFTFAVSNKKEIATEPDPRYASVKDDDLNDLSSDLNAISLYPNPVKKGQDFTVVFPKMENLVISVYDGGGRLVQLEKISSSARSYTSRLNVQSAYLVNLTQNGKIIKTFKLIVD